MKKAFLFLFTILISTVLFAQDIIIMKNGDEIKSKVSEIGINEIKYKKFDDLEGPVIVVPKSDVFMIKYENGTKDIIESVQSGDKAGVAVTVKHYYANFICGLSVPLGNFAEAQGGAAKMGAMIGHEGMVATGNNNFFITYKLDYIYHPYSFNVAIPVYNNTYPYYHYTQNYEYKGNYNILNGLFGFRVQSNPSKAIAYFSFLGGINYTQIAGDLQEIFTDHSGISFAFEAAFGTVISKHFNVGIKYFQAEPTFSEQIYIQQPTYPPINYNSSFEVKQKIETFQFCAGYEF